MSPNPLLPSDQEPASVNLVRQACRSFYRDAGLNPTEAEIVDSYADLKEKIARVVIQLLEYDPPKLVHLMYRLDIDECRFNAAMSQTSCETIADQVAELVLEREKQKVFWRNKYRE